VKVSFHEDCWAGDGFDKTLATFSAELLRNIQIKEFSDENELD